MQFCHRKRINNGEQKTLNNYSIRPVKEVLKKQIRMGGFTAHGKLI